MSEFAKKAVRNALTHAMGFAMDNEENYSVIAPRLIPTFAGTQYGTLDTPITFTGDCRIKAIFATTNGENQIITGDSHLTNLYISTAAATANDINIYWLGSKKIFNFAADIDDSKIHELEMIFSGEELTAFIDGVASTDNGSYTGLSNQSSGINFLIGNSNSLSAEFEGQILSVKFTDQSGAEDVITNYVFDSGSTTEQFARGSTTLKVTLTNFATTDWNRYTLQRNITHDSGVITEAWIGENVVVNGGFGADTDWTKSAERSSISGGEAHFVTGGDVFIYQDILTINDNYLVDLDYNITSENSLFCGSNNGTGDAIIDLSYSSVGSIKDTIKASHAFFIIRDNNAIGTEASFDNASVQHLLEVA